MSRATPVEVADLVAHLSVYRSSYPAITALYACNQYGKGEHAYINRLPVEIVDMIVIEMLYEQYPAATKEWYDKSECFEDRCMRECHFTPPEMEEVLNDALEERMRAHNSDPAEICLETGCKGTCISYPAVGDEDVQDILVDDGIYGDIHHVRRQQWRAFVDEDFIRDNVRGVSQM